MQSEKKYVNKKTNLNVKVSMVKCCFFCRVLWSHIIYGRFILEFMSSLFIASDIVWMWPIFHYSQTILIKLNIFNESKGLIELNKITSFRLTFLENDIFLFKF